LAAFLSFVETGQLAVEPALDSIPSVAWHVEAVILVQVLGYYLDLVHEQLLSCVSETVALAEGYS